jgi:hypothetical protein
VSLNLRAVLLVTVSTATILAADPSELAPEGILQNYLAASQAQAEAKKPASMDVDIQAALPNMQKQGRLHALRKISSLGRITYDKLFFEGDNTVKHEVIARYLKAETEAQENASESTAVTPANYKFKYKGRTTINGRDAYLFQVTPKKKRVELFKGEIWIDASTYLPIEESGYLSKSPSIWLKRVAFHRIFEIRDGLSIPRQVQTIVEMRLFGKAEVTVDYSNYSLAEDAGEFNQ